MATLVTLAAACADSELGPPEPDPLGSRDGCALIDLADSGHLLTASQAQFIVQSLGQMTAILGVGGEVRLSVVADAAMAELHAEFSGDASTTDVLTFDLSEGQAAATRQLDVDIYTCFDEAVRQGAARGHAPERELLLYAIHGVLHCLGFDDHSDDQYAAMHAKEDELLAAIGLPATFKAGDSAAASNGGSAS